MARQAPPRGEPQRVEPPSRRDLLLGAAGLVAVAGKGAWAEAASARRFFRISSGSSGGMYYPLAGLIAAAVSNPMDGQGCDIEDVCGVPGLVAVAQTSAGSFENLQLLLSRQVESAFCQADIALRAARGEIEGTPLDLGRRLRVIAYLYPEYLHIVVRRNSGIRLLADLAGKRVSLGPEGSGTYRDASIFLQAFGLKETILRRADLTAVAAARDIRDGSLDAFLLVSGLPATAVKSLASERLIDLVPLEGVAANRLQEMRPPFRPALIQSGLYDHIAITPSLSVGALWLVTEELDAKLVYEITRSLWSAATVSFLARNDTPLGPQIKLENALTDVGTPPLHSGAERFYKAAGLL